MNGKKKIIRAHSYYLRYIIHIYIPHLSVIPITVVHAAVVVAAGKYTINITLSLSI